MTINVIARAVDRPPEASLGYVLTRKVWLRLKTQKSVKQRNEVCHSTDYAAGGDRSDDYQSFLKTILGGVMSRTSFSSSVICRVDRFEADSSSI